MFFVLVALGARFVHVVRQAHFRIVIFAEVVFFEVGRRTHLKLGPFCAPSRAAARTRVGPNPWGRWNREVPFANFGVFPLFFPLFFLCFSLCFPFVFPLFPGRLVNPVVVRTKSLGPPPNSLNSFLGSTLCTAWVQ